MNEFIAGNKNFEMKNFELLKKDIEYRISNPDFDKFSMFIFEVTNSNRINRYMSYEHGKESILKTVKIAKKIFSGCQFYSIYENEIAIIIDNEDTGETYHRGKELLKAFENPVFINSIPIHIMIKGGIVNYPVHGNDTYSLYQNLGRTLSQNTFDNNTISIYDETIARRIKNYYNVKLDLFNAIINNDLRLEYQPKYSIREQKVIGFEALLRWDYNDSNIAEVINIAEETNLINQLTVWITKQIILQLEEWKAKGFYTKVSINVSPKDLVDDSYINQLKYLVDNSSISADMIEIELTERSVYENDNNIVALMKKIIDYGFSISIDDYGTGYNSLKNVLVYPFHYIKIDKFFIDRLNKDNSYLIVKGILNIANRIGIGIIAEGVETQQQYDLLKDLNCEIIQGYYFSRPLKPKDCIKFLSRMD